MAKRQKQDIRTAIGIQTDEPNADLEKIELLESILEQLELLNAK